MLISVPYTCTECRLQVKKGEVFCICQKKKLFKYFTSFESHFFPGFENYTFVCDEESILGRVKVCKLERKSSKLINQRGFWRMEQ